MDTYEKKYREALERAKKELVSCGNGRTKMLERIFPELAESEDEKIRKGIFKALSKKDARDVLISQGVEVSDALAWLEKQKKQSNTNGLLDKFTDEDYKRMFKSCNPRKFKVGDFIANDYCVGKVIELTDDAYLLDTGQGIPFSCEHNAHLWTIQDAMDGDVLAFKNDIGGIIICKSPTDYDTGSYCRLASDNLINKEESGWDSTLLVPATKEQSTELFLKMHEAGYEWDAEKKDLKKIRNALEECEIEHIEHGKYYYCIKDYYSGGCKRVSKGEVVQALRGMSMMALGVKANEYFIPVKCIVDINLAWSGEDNLYYDDICEILMNLLHSERTDINKDAIQKDLDWLWHIKEKTQRNEKDTTSDETNAPTEYGKYVDECLYEASKHFFSEGEDKYSVADLFYAGVRCGKSWFEKQGEQKSLNYVAKEITKNKETAMSFLKSCGIMNANGELADEYKIEQDEQKDVE